MRLLICIVFLTLLVMLPGQAQVINEVMSSNGNIIADAAGDYEDWIELYNPGDTPIDLTGYYLSDNVQNPLKWQFPRGHIEPGGHLLVWASSKNTVDSNNWLHTNFSISSDGEPLILTAPDGVTSLDFVPATYIPRDVSYGRQGDGADIWVFFTEPTPGTENSTSGYYGVLDPPVFSHEAGFYEDGFHLELTHPDPDVTIYYTVDGSTASVDSQVYAEPIWIDSRNGEPNNISLIPTAPDYEWRAPLSVVFKSTVVNTTSVRDGYISSHPMVKTYFVDSDIHNKYSVPVISISTDNEHLFSEETGILVPGIKFNNGSQWGHQANYTQTGVDWERPATMEFFEKDGTLAFSSGIGLRIHGGSTRRMDQKSIRVYFRNSYGMDTLEYRLFPDKPITSYRRFILRSLRVYSPNDEFYQSLAEGLDIDYQYARPAVVFINGEYWGLHVIRDRIDEHHLALHHGIQQSEVNLIDGLNNMSISHGSFSNYIALMQFIDTTFNRSNPNLDISP